ncbi:MAG: CYTH domain-containing protein [Herbinix sp.]|nr:CYTH domain-containing protein [Herbinix sp.]
MEIERKYAINNLPGELSQYQFKKIEQGYLCHNPTIRIRKSNDNYILTYKSKLGIGKRKEGDAIINNEVELPLTKEAYNELLPKTDDNLIIKTRYLVPLDNGLTAELDVFEGFLNGLVFTEVEFPDEKTANEFVPPAWFGKELSSNKQFSNYNLSKLSSIDGLGI